MYSNYLCISERHPTCRIAKINTSQMQVPPKTLNLVLAINKHTKVVYILTLLNAHLITPTPPSPPTIAVLIHPNSTLSPTTPLKVYQYSYRAFHTFVHNSIMLTPIHLVLVSSLRAFQWYAFYLSSGKFILAIHILPF